MKHADTGEECRVVGVTNIAVALEIRFDSLHDLTQMVDVLEAAKMRYEDHLAKIGCANARDDLNVKRLRFLVDLLRKGQATL